MMIFVSQLIHYARTCPKYENLSYGIQSLKSLLMKFSSCLVDMVHNPAHDLFLSVIFCVV